MTFGIDTNTWVRVTLTCDTTTAMYSVLTLGQKQF